MASSLRATRLVPIAVDARPEKPMKYARLAVRKRSFRRINGTAISSIGRTEPSAAGSINIPKVRKKIATNASRRDSILTFIRPAMRVSAKTIPMKNAPTMAGIRNASARDAARKTVPSAKRTNSSSLLMRSKIAAVRGTTTAAKRAKKPMNNPTPPNRTPTFTGASEGTIIPLTSVRRNMARNDSRITMPSRNSVSAFPSRFRSISDFAVIAELDMLMTPAMKIVSIRGHPSHAPMTNPANMFTGFVIGAWLGWPLIDTIFMAGVISMSSSAITAKSLIDLKRLGNAETEFLLGMVILESFLAMFLLTLVNGMIVPSDTPVNVGLLFGGVGLFIGFFALLAAVVVPRTAAIFERIKNEELFVLFALGTVFLAASLAEAFRIPAIVGAFFMGMVFADTRIAGRMKVKMESLRDAFVAIFFLTFGMLIDPAALGSVLPMLAIAVPLILLNDLFLTASLAYFIGFSGRASTAIGTSLIARNEEAILYATVGARAIRANPQLSNDYAGTYLTPFAGILCIGPPRVP